MALTKGQKFGIVGGIALVSLITFIVIRRNKNKKTIETLNKILDGVIKDPNQQTEGKVVVTKQQLDTLPLGRFPLKFKDRSRKVYDLQRLLNRKYGLNIDEDGRFGQSTASALCKNYFKTCFTDVQSRLYEVTENDFKELSKSSNFNGIK